MSWGTSTPPPPSSAVFTVSGSATISAPPEKAWEALLDFDSYKQWNPFIRSLMIINNPTSSPLIAGDNIRMNPVYLPPSMDDDNVGFLQKNSNLVQVTVLDRENHRVAWRRVSLLPRWMLDAERWQTITVPTKGGEGCKYESYEVFRGILAYIVRWSLKKKIELGVDAMAQGLKERVERD